MENLFKSFSRNGVDPVDLGPLSSPNFLVLVSTEVGDPICYTLDRHTRLVDTYVP